jgi:hypothetical protein
MQSKHIIHHLHPCVFSHQNTKPFTGVYRNSAEKLTPPPPMFFYQKLRSISPSQSDQAPKFGRDESATTGAGATPFAGMVQVSNGWCVLPFGGGANYFIFFLSFLSGSCCTVPMYCCCTLLWGFGLD